MCQREKSKKILVAIIAYNEENNIDKVIIDLKKNNFGYDIVLIDNGSSDKTPDIAENHGINVIKHCINSGGSPGTLRTYFIYSYLNDYDIVCQFDGDGQHNAIELEKIIKPIIDNQANYVIGSRFIDRTGFQSSFFRRIGINIFSKITSIITKTKITDVTSGFRAYDKNIINYFSKFYKHEIYDTSQLLLLSYFAGAKIIEVPVVINERQQGKSEFSSIKTIFYPFYGLINIIGCLLQKDIIRKQYGIKN